MLATRTHISPTSACPLHPHLKICLAACVCPGDPCCILLNVADATWLRAQVRLTAGPENKTPPRSSLREQRILSAEGFQARTPSADSPVPLAPASEPREDAPPPPQEAVKDEL